MPRPARLLALLVAPLMTAAAAPDPYLWLEQVHGPRPDAWVAADRLPFVGKLPDALDAALARAPRLASSLTDRSLRRGA